MGPTKGVITPGLSTETNEIICFLPEQESLMVVYVYILPSSMILHSIADFESIVSRGFDLPFMD